jgi:hypothetical protein
MSFRTWHVRLDKAVCPLRRALQYSSYDWTREMPKSKRLITWAAILIQGYAIYAGFSRSLIWPWIWPKGFIRYPTILLLYYVGHSLMNRMLTSEFVRKTQLESDQIAARQIQQMLIPQTLPELSGYKAAMFYNFCEKSGVIVLM